MIFVAVSSTWCLTMSWFLTSYPKRTLATLTLQFRDFQQPKTDSGLIIKSNQITNPSLGLDKQPQWIDTSFWQDSIQLHNTLLKFHMEHCQEMFGTFPYHRKKATILKFHSYFIHFTVSSCFVFSMLGCLRHLFKKRRPQVTRILKTLRLVRVFRFIMALRTLALWLSFILWKDWIDWWDVPVVFVTHFFFKKLA